MKKIYCLFLVVLMVSCSVRKVERTKERVKLFEKGEIERTAPGDRVYIEFPKSPKDRPRNIIKTYTGKRGAIVEVPFDSTGNATGFRADCPEIPEREKYDRELNYKVNEKKSERQFNALAMKEGRTTILWMTAIISLAWVARGFFSRR